MVSDLDQPGELRDIAELIAERLPAWSSNRLKRLARRPKRYLVDAALITAALRIDARSVMRDGDLLGRVIDTFVLAQLRPELGASSSTPVRAPTRSARESSPHPSRRSGAEVQLQT